MNFSFRLPRTDVCDVCFSFENDKKDKEVYDDHVARFKHYKVLKKEMLQKRNVLHIEFDFGQNLPCPKIPVNSQFYCRLPWLYIFNVHVLTAQAVICFIFSKER